MASTHVSCRSGKGPPQTRRLTRNTEYSQSFQGGVAEKISDGAPPYTQTRTVTWSLGATFVAVHLPTGLRPVCARASLQWSTDTSRVPWTATPRSDRNLLGHCHDQIGLSAQSARSRLHCQFDRSDMSFDNVYGTFCSTLGLRICRRFLHHIASPSQCHHPEQRENGGLIVASKHHSVVTQSVPP